MKELIDCAAVDTPQSLLSRFWYFLGYRQAHTVIDRPHPPRAHWIRINSEIRLEVWDRILLLVSGRITVSQVVYTDILVISADTHIDAKVSKPS